MKKKTTTGIRLVLGVLLCFAVFTACKKEAGPKGDKGAPGNANVIGLDPVTVTADQWLNSDDVWLALLEVPEITQEVMDHGMVQVYVMYNTKWWTLPYIQGIQQTTFAILPGQVMLYRANLSNTPAGQPSDRQYRVVVVAPAQLDAHPDVNWNNYTEVKEALDLEN
jgi:hypothetical protein